MANISVLLLKQNFLIQSPYDYQVSDNYLKTVSFGTVILVRFNGVLKEAVVIKITESECEKKTDIQVIRHLSLNQDLIKTIYLKHGYNLNYVLDHLIFGFLTKKVDLKLENHVQTTNKDIIDIKHQKQLAILEFLGQESCSVASLKKQFGPSSVLTLIKNKYLDVIEKPIDYQAKLSPYSGHKTVIKDSRLLLRNNPYLTCEQLLDLNLAHFKIAVVIAPSQDLEITHQGVYKLTNKVAKDQLDYNYQKLQTLDQYVVITNIDNLALLKREFDLVIFLDDFLINNESYIKLSVIYNYYNSKSKLLVLSKLPCFDTLHFFNTNKYLIDDKIKQLNSLKIKTVSPNILDLTNLEYLLNRAKSNKVLVMLNDSDYAKKVMCGDCKQLITCPKCKFKMHIDQNMNCVCRYCKHVNKELICNTCESSNLIYDDFGGLYIKQFIEQKTKLIDFKYCATTLYHDVYIYQLPRMGLDQDQNLIAKHLLNQFGLVTNVVLVNTKSLIQTKLFNQAAVDFITNYYNENKRLRLYPFKKTCTISVFALNTIDLLSKVAQIINNFKDLNPVLTKPLIDRRGRKIRRVITIDYSSNIDKQLRKLNQYCYSNKIEIQIKQDTYKG